jgi:hypothetical protein
MIAIRRLVACDPLRDEADALIDTGSRLLTITIGRELERDGGGTIRLGAEYWIGDEPASPEEFRDVMRLLELRSPP